MSDSPLNPAHKKAEELVSLLKRGYAKLVRLHNISALLIGGSVLFAGLVLLFLSEHWFYLSAEFKSAAFLLTLLAAFLGWRQFRTHSTPTPFHLFYSEFLESIAEQKVQNAIDLHLYPDQNSVLFRDAAIRKNLEHTDTETIRNQLENYLKGKSVYKIFQKSALTLLLLSSILGSFLFFEGQSAQRALTFWTTYTQPNPFEFVVAPGDTLLEQGARFTPTVMFDGEQIPERVLFSFKTDVEDSFRNWPMQKNEEGTFTTNPIELTGNIRYRIEMDSFYSNEFSVDVRVQPRFDHLFVEVTPPEYTRLENTRIEYPYSDISFYPGSEITFSGKSNKPIEQIYISFRNEQEIIESISSDSSFTYSIRPERTDTLTFRMIDSDGIENRNPYRTILKLTEDRIPSVTILEPVGTVHSSGPDELPIQYRVTDDFGLTRAELHWSLQRAFVDKPIQNRVNLSSPGNGYTERYNWNLSDLELRPRDRVEFKIVAWDNDTVSGPKYGESNTVTLIVPSLAESFEELDRRERDIQGDMDEISENFQNMEREYQEFLERLRQNPEGGFEEEQILEEIREQQSDIDEAVQQMNDRFEQLRNETMSNDNISEETQKAYRELQQLMRELDDPALREAMEELQNALQNMSPEEIEQALENVSFNENLYRERLERTVELFKQLKMNSDLDKLARQYEDLSERLSPDEEANPGELLNELQNSSDDLESISEQLENLDQNPPRNARERLQQLKEQAQDRLNETTDKLDDLESQVSDQMERGEQQTDEQTRQDQQEISRQLKEQSEEFRAARSQMSGQQIQVNILALQHALYTLLELSDSQEYITINTGETRSRSQGYVDLARNQKIVADQFSITADTLFKVSSELPGVPNQINRKKAEVERSLNNSLDEMVERNQRNASIASREAFAGINDLASMLASLIDQLMDQQGGSGSGMSMQQMIEQLQNMSGDQQQLNQQLQELINDMQGDRLSQEQAERLDQLARQQNEIRRQLRELQQRGELDSGDRALSEIERMIEEMEESINDMRGGITDPIMNQRQQNILSRMLDAEQALQQRGETDEREGTASSEYDRTLPPEMTIEELEQEIRTRLQDPNFTPFSETFQRLIERYFEQLRRFEQQSVQPD
ncbi:DUF4175 family protein [Rhodohalobacter halophilus]|uniref:DUF4175 family protein n=1 Tax=Rhodohalobacter halophilus TaxID=1812810 RepID=UPI00083FB359|nr:DUF4175 family protein [Rhodohalobacter halophilus]